jgi:diguanylate cyclase (GGDEF)-like protein
VVVSSLREDDTSSPREHNLPVDTVQDMSNLLLVVGGSMIGRRHLKLVLEQFGYIVSEAGNGEEALSIYHHAHPDLVILNMGGKGDALEQYWHLLQLADSQHIPLLLLAEGLSESELYQAFEWGVTDYLNTPVHKALLKYRIIYLLKQSQQYRQLTAENQRLSRLAILDGLTQLANRRRFDDHLERMWRHMIREKGWLSIILMDVDCFKSYNDTYGHVAGDICLQKVASVLREYGRRPLDLAARYGGEEFALVLPQTPLKPAIALAEQVKKTVYNLHLPHEQSEVDSVVTISLGVASVRPSLNDTFESLIESSDTALYTAKQQGRNQVVAYHKTKAL